MPYATEKLDHQYSVFNKETGKFRAKATTKAKAEKQLRLLNAIEHGFVPATDYRTFVKQEMKKRPLDMLPKDYMKVIAKKWHEIKGTKSTKGRGEPILLSPGLSDTAAAYPRAY